MQDRLLITAMLGAMLLVSEIAEAQPVPFDVAVPKLRWTADEVATLARPQYFEGVPLDVVASFPQQVAQPVLLKMLNNPAEAAAWPNVAAMLGIIGDDAAARALIAFVDRGGKLAQGPEGLRALSGAILGLGYFAHRTQSRMATNWLSKAAQNPNRPLAETATLALGLAAQPETRQVLERLPRTLVRQDIIEEALRTHDQVTDKGMLGYYNLRGMPNLKRFQPGRLDRVLPRRPADAEGAGAALHVLQSRKAEARPVRERGQLISPAGKSQVLRPPLPGTILPPPSGDQPAAIPNPTPSEKPPR